MESLYQQFRLRAEAVSTEVYRLGSRAKAESFAREMMRQEGGTAVWAGSAEPALLVTKERAAAAKVGVTEADLAIADTGSLLMDASLAERRLASTLPEVHIALTPFSGLRETLGEALAGIDPRRARYLAAVTGPSRTADIERVLTIGVHGPVRLIVAFYEEKAA
ncbi:MAG: lactate utilization protein [Acidobacteria bacterium]|nr:lactate utilization protein [Acidobacteriota bacterium]